MTAQDSTFQKKEIVLMAILAFVAMALLTVAIVPSFRTAVKDVLISDERTLLAKVSGSVTPEGPRITVLKVRIKDVINVEIYSQEPNEENTLIARLPLFENRDGYFTLNGNATNLALTDVDNDGSLEIVAPTYNDQMVPRLNVFKYNRASKGFDRVNAPPGYGQ